MEYTLGERLVIVEEKIIELKVAADARAEEQHAILDNLKLLNEQLQKYKGFLGGIVFVVTCISTFLYYFIQPLINVITKLKSGN